MTTLCAHVLRDADALTTVCLLCGHTHTQPDPQAAQRARTASQLAYWASTTGDVWPGVAPGHRALLEHLAHVFAGDVVVGP